MLNMDAKSVITQFGQNVTAGTSSRATSTKLTVQALAANPKPIDPSSEPTLNEPPSLVLLP